MKCDQCNIELLGAERQCPLCQGDLIGNPSEDAAVFPRIPYIMRPNHEFLRRVGFVSVVAAIVCLAIDFSFPERNGWSILVIAAIISLWLSLIIILKKRGNIHKTIIYQVVLISSIAVIWDLYTGFHRWSVDFVIPIASTSAMVLMAVLARIMKLKIRDFMVYLMLNIIIAIVSLILLLCGVLTNTVASVVCFSMSAIFLAALILFEGRAFVAEIQRRTHI